MCTPCRQVSGIGTDRAPDFGSDFWRTDQMRDAFATRDMGTVVRTYRYHPAHGHKPLPQETLSRWLGTVTQSQLSRIESGRNKVDTYDKLVHYARALKMPADLLWFSLPDDASDPLPRVDTILALPDGPLVPAASAGPGYGVADALLRTLDNYNATDNLLGPHSLVNVVPQQLRFIESLIDHAHGKDRGQLLYVGARYAEFAGWLYQDAGALDTAMQLSNSALDLAQEAGHDMLGAYVLMRKSNIATDAQRPGLALKLADAAMSRTERLSPRMQAVVLRQRAHAQLQSGDLEGCAHTLDAAFQLAEQTPDSELDLAQYCTPEYLEMEAAHCWVEMGRATEAVAVLQQGLARWQPAYRRDLGLGLARLSVAHASREEADHAVYVAERALAIAMETRSSRISSQIDRVPALLATAGADDHARMLNTRISQVRSRKEL
jgi:transcriptional regulator with XRE-family HTH domain